MTDEPKHKIENGERVEVEIEGEIVLAGLTSILGQCQLAYLPKSARRPEPGTILTIKGKKFKVLRSRQSQFMMRMVVLEIKPLEDADAA